MESNHQDGIGEIMKKYAVRGINDDTDTCSECGKTSLKKVVWLVSLSPEGDEISEAFPVGVDCASRLLGWNCTRGKAEAKINAIIEKEQVQAVLRKIESIEKSIVWSKDLNAWYPQGIVDEYLSGKMSRKQAFEARIERFPIFGYLAGRIGLADAIKLV